MLTVDYKIPTTDGTHITGRLYKTETMNTDHLIIYYHGGGYLAGSIETHDLACRWLASDLQMPLFSIDYRLAPEFQFPTPVEDGYSAFLWLSEHAAQIGIPYQKLIVAGDSAGANLATLVSILARDRHGPKIDFQFLLYPWVSQNIDTPSYREYAQNYLLSKQDCCYFMEQYLSTRPQPYSPFPLENTTLEMLPPAFITVAECDVLHDEGVAYANKLRQAGNTVYEFEAPGMIHGFLNHFTLPSAYQIMSEILGKFDKILSSTVR
jgi:acetyl esterase